MSAMGGVPANSMGAERRLRLAVTGANGFIGSAIVRACVDQRIDVAGLTRSTLSRIVDVAGEADALIHAAGLAHRTRGVSYEQFHAVNVDGTRAVLDTAARARIAHVVLISSAAVYGRGGLSSSPVDEDAPCAPGTAYARSKLEGERIATARAAEHGIRLTIVRPATVFGEGDPGSVAQLTRLLHANRFLWIGAGSNRKSLTHVDDLAAACVRLAFDHQRESPIYNIAGPPVSMREIVEALADGLGRTAPRLGIPDPIARAAWRMTAPLASRGDRLRWMHDRLTAWLSDDVYAATKFESRHGPIARTDWREGLRREAAWLLASMRSPAAAAPPR